MATVTLSYSGASPASVGDTDAARVVWYLDLYDVGPSRGSNLTVSDSDGTEPRDRERDELAVSLTWDIRGSEDLSGSAATDIYQQMRHNIRDLSDWLDDAPGRQVTVTLEDGTTWTGTAQHEEWARPEWHGLFVRRRQLLTVSAGALT